jgi:hypothetical protein
MGTIGWAWAEWLVVVFMLGALVGCGTDKAACGGIVNSGTLTGPVTSNCANGNAGVGMAGTTDSHDDRHDITNPPPEGGAL